MKRKENMFLFPLLLTAVCILFPREAGAQNETEKTFRHSLAVQPFYWLNNGFRIDYERQLTNPSHWLQLSAIGYYVEDENSLWNAWWMQSDFPLNEAWGAGLEVNYKYFPLRNREYFPFRSREVYVSGGLSSSHFNVNYNTESIRYLSYVENGLTYYEPQWEQYETSQYFNRIGTNLCAGVQSRPTKRFLIDGYIGIGYIYSFYGKDKYPYNDSNKLSYRGLTLTAGLRIGFRL
ncbi:MAG: hypothetical protein LBS04_04215 [Tannerellaceae bacterium]|jgi:hypothetical protein|nr:hypothetical protein [Tannerellaceae bacterium]